METDSDIYSIISYDSDNNESKANKAKDVNKK
jgi:hypothetical protein